MKRLAREVFAGVLLGALCLLSFRIANILPLFKTYSSIWFLPSGVMLAIVFAAPGWLKLVPLLAGLSLYFPAVRDSFALSDEVSITHVIRAIRLYLIYGAAAWILLKITRVSLPIKSWRDVQAFLGVGLVASLIAALTSITLQVAGNRLQLADGLSLAHLWWLGHALGAVMVPPILVPLLMLCFRQPLGEWQWPPPLFWLGQSVIITLAVTLGIVGPNFGVALWYLIIPVLIIVGLYGGFEKSAATVLLAGVITPLLGTLFEGPLPVSDLAVPLVTAAAAALLIGAATSERQRTAQRLIELVAQRTHELEKSHEMQRHLVRSLGHDLRQPVEAINLTIEGLSMKITDPQASRSLARARELGEAASRLLTRILFYARLDVGDVQVHSEAFEIVALISQLQALYGPIASRNGVVLLWDFPEAELKSDRELLFQVLVNHLDNAIRLSSKGDRVTVRIAEEAHGTGLFVIDQIAENAAQKPGAAGLGLRIVTQIADLLGADSIIEANRRGIILPYPERGI
ncbi:histidine kinase dimerization/phospho-acceptor domain-containing protein [Devosia sp. Leaf64]|uniref:sensor histidine kinase n=1 Tax=Devosia sp. Leaf64 TaxID=1736229 RepID=UPI00071316B0|nr:histidine kinase dimerization/phospho-acceptor domain-containing protein [Devosia sp. Leaf64]KQN76882.1 hypothetical protein ASE94_18320 [Devosia sp. Leaf64]